ncbi:MAG: hypothetical protein RLY93_10960 [Sumerlaeia bacterium]
MKKALWHFANHRPSDVSRDPIAGEFFSQDAVDGPARALVREGIQNSLDAACKRPVRVRLALGELTAEQVAAAPWFDGLWEHLEANRSGLLHPPRRAGRCRFLVFEDFGTLGLDGDVREYRHRDTANPFYAFFRAEGESSKESEDSRGRWGVGKFVFPRASQGQTFFGLTVREVAGAGPERLMLGRTILKHHELPDGEAYRPDGFFGERNDAGEIVLPLSDPASLSDFSTLFGLAREPEDLGLSIVVCWCDERQPDSTELEFTGKRLALAVAQEYFDPILRGTLQVDVEAPDLGADPCRLDGESLPSQLDRPPLADECEELRALVALSREALACENLEGWFVAPPHPNNKPAWKDVEFPEDQLERWRTRFESGRPLCLRVPLTLRPKGKAERKTYFHVILQRCEDSTRPTYVRGDLVITEAHGTRTRRLRGARGLVLVREAALSEMLGDAENIAHTEWRRNSSNLKDKWAYAGDTIAYVQQSATRLLEAMKAAEEDEPDRNFLLDFFSVQRAPEPQYPVEQEAADRSLASQVSEDDAAHQATLEPADFPESPPPYQVNKLTGGFRVQGINPGTGRHRVAIRMAYAVRRGDPFKVYAIGEKAGTPDFDLADPASPLQVAKSESLGLEKLSGNSVVLTSEGEGKWSARVLGFDQNRDVVIDVSLTGGGGPDDGS